MGYYETFMEFVPLVRLLTSNLADQGIVKPKDYLMAAVQNFGVTLWVTWLITLYYDPNQVLNHPVKPMIGSMNPCFGWDYPPASYVAVFMTSINVYFTWRWAFLENARTKLQTGSSGGGCVQGFVTFTCWFMAFASNLWLLLWLIGPANTHYTEDPNDLTWETHEKGMLAWMTHIGLFGIYTLACFMAVLGNYLEVRFSPRSTVLKPKHTAFVIIYGCSVFYLIFVYMYAITLYELGEPPATGSMYPTYIADFVWELCTLAVPFFTAPEIPLKITVEMANEDPEGKE
jgi:hypothetical protein